MKHFGNFVALLIVAVNALFTGLLLLVAYSPYIQPATHPVQSCLGLTFPVFALINGGFLIFWLVIQRYKTALLPLTGLLLCYSQLRTYLPLNFHTTELPEGSIKLLSYNIMGFLRCLQKRREESDTHLSEREQCRHPMPAGICIRRISPPPHAERHRTGVERLSLPPYQRRRQRQRLYQQDSMLFQISHSIRTCPGLCKQLQRFRTV